MAGFLERGVSSRLFFSFSLSLLGFGFAANFWMRRCAEGESGGSEGWVGGFVPNTIPTVGNGKWE